MDTEVKLGSSCLCGRYFTDGAISQPHTECWEYKGKEQRKYSVPEYF